MLQAQTMLPSWPMRWTPVEAWAEAAENAIVTYLAQIDPPSWLEHVVRLDRQVMALIVDSVRDGQCSGWQPYKALPYLCWVSYVHYAILHRHRPLPSYSHKAESRWAVVAGKRMAVLR